jgi:signal peptidase I
MNFALILVILSALSGFIYLADVLYLGPRRKKSAPMPKVIEYARSFFPVFITVLIFRSFLIEPFRIPSSSLEPTLLVGDFVAVNKFAYGLRMPVWEKKIVPIASPKTGEVVVFRWPPNPSIDYIKRVIGVPGDHIVYHNKKLIINDVPVNQSFIEYTTDESSGRTVALSRETLNGVVHDIFTRPDIQANDFDITVPPHSYFMMGDNRDDSSDSRYWGFVSDHLLRGKAFLIWMSWNSKEGNVRFNRVGHLIH